MALRYSEDFEDVLQQAVKLDEQISDFWAEMVGDEEYQTLVEFFSRDNFFDTWEDEELDRETVIKKLKRILVGKDRLKLIEYAFDLGQLVGMATYAVQNHDD